MSEETTKQGWFARLRAALARSSQRLASGISDLFSKGKLDAETLEELEDLLIMADLGVETARKLSTALAKTRMDRDVTADEVKSVLATEIAAILQPVAQPLTLVPGAAPTVILVVGVNGAGKTTTIGKLAKSFRDEGRTVMLAAGDTFRAAAVEQLVTWGERLGCPVVTAPQGADAAGLAYDALARAKVEGADVLLIDTAGRLQNKAGLMDELAKIRRVLGKQDGTAPHHTLLVLDATVGQNAHAQVKTFRHMTAVTGLVMTKLDGTAKGGVLVALADAFGLPVHAVGVGEGAEDLKAFAADGFAQSLLGLD